MERYDKSTISSSGVRVLVFSIGDSLFCLDVSLLITHLCTGREVYLIGIKILDQIYFYIILISVPKELKNIFEIKVWGKIDVLEY